MHPWQPGLVISVLPIHFCLTWFRRVQPAQEIRSFCLHLAFIITSFLMADKKSIPYPFIHGGGKMGSLIQNRDWSTSPIGTPDTWPHNLRTSINILLNSKFPMFVWWGADLITFYNDAYISIAGEKHPAALGAPGSQVWAEIWNVVGPLANRVMQQAEPTWSEDQRLLMNRHGYREETYFTFSYSPVFDDAGNVNGVFCACTETTGKVLAARKVIESEQNLRNVILQAPVGMGILRGPQFVIEIANIRLLELWGKTEVEVINKPLWEVLPEAKNQGFEELLDEVYTTGETKTDYGVPVTLMRNGKLETVYVKFVFEPFKEANGVISGVMIVAHDVTRLVLASQKLQANEAELQQRVDERTTDLEQQKKFIASILDASFNGIYALKALRSDGGKIEDFLYLFANSNIAATLQKSLPQVLESTMLTLLPENKSNGFFDLFCRTLEDAKPVHDVTHFITGQLNNWYDYAVVPIDKDTLVVTLQDITEQKKTLEEVEDQRNLLNSIMKNSPSGITVTQVIRNEAGDVVDGRTILANDVSEKYTGISLAEAYSKTVTELDPNILTSPLFNMVLHALKTGEPFITQYYLEPIERWLELSVAKMDDDHLINVFTDVTPIKKTHLLLEKSVEDLQRSNANLREFAYAASHDLKEPIRKVHIFSDRLKMLLNDRLTEDERLYFDRLERAAKRMGSLIDDLLYYSQVSLTATSLETVNLNELIELVLTDLDLEIEQKSATVSVGKLFSVQGNHRQLQQAFQNLIFNALKYNRPGVPPQIKITCERVAGNNTGQHLSIEEQHQTFYRVSIQDNGIGFEQKDHERIFNLFTRLHGNTEYTGTGIGLSIVRKVIENHHGFIVAESEPQKGATFNLFFPAGDDET